ncbi:MAG: amino acid permease [Peptococcaceae bacterium]|nr:amino acid permease [Peptococcaceae bacterium]
MKQRLRVEKSFTEKEVGQVITQRKQAVKSEMSAGSLIWVGLGGIIGAGFFLASGLAIKQAGPGVIFAYLLGGLLLAQVAGALTTLSVDHPVRGSFRVYAEEFIGPYMGFVVGWAFWISSILGIGSETVAMAIFTEFWFPGLPLWLISLIYLALVIGLNAFGVKNFGRIESLMSMVKVGALFAFICISVLAVFHLLPSTGNVGFKTLLGNGGLLPMGISGMLRSMLIVIFAYAGISIVAMAASEVTQPRITIPGVTLKVVIILLVIYTLSMFLITSLTPWQGISAKESPFVAALAVVGVPWASSLMNAIILVAAFSVMTGAFFAAMTMLISMGDDGQAPRILGKPSKNGVFYPSLIASALGVLLTVVVAYLLPSKVYNYLTSASAYFSFLNWLVILTCYLLLRKAKRGHEFTSPLSFGRPWTTWLTLAVILVLFDFSLTVLDQRMGFYSFVGFVLLINLGYAYYRTKNKGRSGDTN